MVINGEQLPFLEVLRSLHKNWSRLAHEAALKIVEEQFADRTQKVYDLLDQLQSQLKAMCGATDEEEG